MRRLFLAVVVCVLVATADLLQDGSFLAEEKNNIDIFLPKTLNNQGHLDRALRVFYYKYWLYPGREIKNRVDYNYVEPLTFRDVFEKPVLVVTPSPNVPNTFSMFYLHSGLRTTHRYHAFSWLQEFFMHPGLKGLIFYPHLTYSKRFFETPLNSIIVQSDLRMSDIFAAGNYKGKIPYMFVAPEDLFDQMDFENLVKVSEFKVYNDVIEVHPITVPTPKDIVNEPFYGSQYAQKTGNILRSNSNMAQGQTSTTGDAAESGMPDGLRSLAGSVSKGENANMAKQTIGSGLPDTLSVETGRSNAGSQLAGYSGILHPKEGAIERLAVVGQQGDSTSQSDSIYKTEVQGGIHAKLAHSSLRTRFRRSVEKPDFTIAKSETGAESHEHMLQRQELGESDAYPSGSFLQGGSFARSGSDMVESHPEVQGEVGANEGGSTIGSLVKTGAGIAGNVASGLVRTTTGIIRTGADIVGNVASGAVKTGSAVVRTGTNIAGNLGTGIVKTGTEIVRTGSEIVGGVSTGIVKVGTEIVEKGTEIVENVGVGIVHAGSEIVRTGTGVAADVGSGIIKTGTEIVGTVGSDLVEKGTKIVGDVAKIVQTNIDATAQNVRNEFTRHHVEGQPRDSDSMSSRSLETKSAPPSAPFSGLSSSSNEGSSDLSGSLNVSPPVGTSGSHLTDDRMNYG